MEMWALMITQRTAYIWLYLCRALLCSLGGDTAANEWMAHCTLSKALQCQQQPKVVSQEAWLDSAYKTDSVVPDTVEPKLTG